MSSDARILLGIATILSAIGFVAIGIVLGPELPLGATPFYLLATFCILISMACFTPSTRPVALRIIGLVVFVTYVVYAYSCIGQKDFVRALAGLLVWGFPGGYVAIWGVYPSWGRGAAAFGANNARRDDDDA